MKLSRKAIAASVAVVAVAGAGAAIGTAGQSDMKLDGGTTAVPYYGFVGDVARHVPAANAQAVAGTKIEASKTEPDKSTYLTLTGQQFGPDAAYNYGHHFIFQGHKLGSPGYLTRINLDADQAHRVTLMATADVNGKALPDIDGSTWDPFAQRLLLTAELGNIYIVEDIGGSTGTTLPGSRQPNSFVYRYVPKVAGDRSNGKLQALQVLDTAGTAITFHAGNIDLDAKNDGIKAEYTYGVTLKTNWVTIHDTATDGTTPFDANALAKAKNATPLKRPENGVFRPDGKFTDFYFTTTGDTNATTAVGADYGGFGGLHHLVTSPTSDTGTLTLLYKGDVGHTGLDNIQFLDKDRVISGEDSGDSLHTQRGFFDAAYVFNVNDDYSKATTNAPVRFIAQGRDPLATIDSGWSGQPGFQNDGDNEITGIHVSDGDASKAGILGAKEPKPWDGKWRVFYTQQHGMNQTFEIVKE